MALDEPISLGEGLTPLVAAPWTHDCHPHFKRDFLSPTGRFKDRSRSVMLSYLRAFGIRPSSKTVLATRARVGSRLRCRRKDGRQDLGTGFHECPKIAPAQAYGSAVELIEGSRTDVEAAAIRQASQDRLYASHNWQAFFFKTRRRWPLNSGKAWALRPP